LNWLYVITGGATGFALGWLSHHILRSGSRTPAPPRSDSRVSGDPKMPTDDLAPTERISSPPPEAASGGTSPNANVAGRIILHLASLGRIGSDEIAKLGHTQQGMREALGIQQGSLAKVLTRLEEADVVASDRRHVSGQPRRLKVYRLTGLGESVARDLRHRPPVR
jgi:hypothetical protein